MIQEEFSRLIYLFQQASEGKNVTVQEVYQRSFEFIDHLKEVIQTGDAEDRKAAVKMMNELYKHLRDHTKMMCEKSGITEQQLIEKSENPANFPPDLWREMQENKAKLAQSGQQLIQLLQPEEKQTLEKKNQASKKTTGKKKAKKSQWMRS